MLVSQVPASDDAAILEEPALGHEEMSENSTESSLVKWKRENTRNGQPAPPPQAICPYCQQPDLSGQVRNLWATERISSFQALPSTEFAIVEESIMEMNQRIGICRSHSAISNIPRIKIQSDDREECVDGQADNYSNLLEVEGHAWNFQETTTESSKLSPNVYSPDDSYKNSFGSRRSSISSGVSTHRSRSNSAATGTTTCPSSPVTSEYSCNSVCSPFEETNMYSGMKDSFLRPPSGSKHSHLPPPPRLLVTPPPQRPPIYLSPAVGSLDTGITVPHLPLNETTTLSPTSVQPILKPNPKLQVPHALELGFGATAKMSQVTEPARSTNSTSGILKEFLKQHIETASSFPDTTSNQKDWHSTLGNTRDETISSKAPITSSGAHELVRNQSSLNVERSNLTNAECGTQNFRDIPPKRPRRHRTCIGKQPKYSVVRSNSTEAQDWVKVFPSLRNSFQDILGTSNSGAMDLMLANGQATICITALHPEKVDHRLIHKILEEHLDNPKFKVEITKGKIYRSTYRRFSNNTENVEEDSYYDSCFYEDSDEESDEDNDEEAFSSVFNRYQERPTCGASIGISGGDNSAASLGGYIVIEFEDCEEPELFGLTCHHLLEDYDHEHPNMGVRNGELNGKCFIIQQPAGIDFDERKEVLQLRKRGREHFCANDGGIGDFEMSDDSELSATESLSKESLRFGKIIYSSGYGTDGDGYEMDWALIGDIPKNRAGNNTILGAELFYDLPDIRERTHMGTSLQKYIDSINEYCDKERISNRERRYLLQIHGIGARSGLHVGTLRETSSTIFLGDGNPSPGKVWAFKPHLKEGLGIHGDSGAFIWDYFGRLRGQIIAYNPTFDLAYVMDITNVIENIKKITEAKNVQLLKPPPTEPPAKRRRISTPGNGRRKDDVCRTPDRTCASEEYRTDSPVRHEADPRKQPEKIGETGVRGIETPPPPGQRATNSKSQCEKSPLGSPESFSSEA